MMCLSHVLGTKLENFLTTDVHYIPACVTISRQEQEKKIFEKYPHHLVGKSRRGHDRTKV